VDPVPDPLILRKSGSARNRTHGKIINVKFAPISRYAMNPRSLNLGTGWKRVVNFTPSRL
jgi:hypothetical protein